MLRLLALTCTVLLAATLAVKDVVADAIPDNGPPYTDQQFMALAPDRLPFEFKDPDRLRNWWGRAPVYLRKHILNSKSEMWWPIVLCNYLGYRPDVTGELNSAKCERQAYEATQRGRNSWTEDGQWKGPTEECVKRNKRTQYGELICD